MPMKIKIEINSPMVRFPDIVAEFTKSSNLWENIFVQFVELSIKILATVASPEVASNDTIRVQHRYHIKHKHRP